MPRQVVAFSYYSSSRQQLHPNKSYAAGIRANLELVQRLYGPSWVVRLYYQLGPADRQLGRQLCELACSWPQLDLCPAEQLPGVPGRDVSDIYPMVWRFLPTLDPQVSCGWWRAGHVTPAAGGRAAVAGPGQPGVCAGGGGGAGVAGVGARGAQHAGPPHPLGAHAGQRLGRAPRHARGQGAVGGDLAHHPRRPGQPRHQPRVRRQVGHCCHGRFCPLAGWCRLCGVAGRTTAWTRRCWSCTCGTTGPAGTRSCTTATGQASD